ncbi:MAG: hypothetical protein PHW69_04850 [Elusimicrobiaceae bacterium]|nr:hypothetical protein [Elusimicrobiaceae bacterium]
MKRLCLLAAALAFCCAGHAEEDAAVTAMDKQCGADLAAGCAPAKTPVEKALCLARSYKTISGDCRAGLDRFFPCGEPAAKNCADTPKEKTVECLLKHHAELAPQCIARLDALLPCALETEKFCAGATGSGNPVCLFDNIGKAGPVCAAAIKQQFPCHQETARLCRGKKTPSDVYDCLAANYAKLSPECIKRRLPCAQDEKKLCPSEKTAGAIERCLKKKRARLSGTCSAAVKLDEKKTKMLTAYICADSIAKFCKTEGEKGDMDKVQACLEKNGESLSGQCKVVAVLAPACETDLDTYCPELEGGAKTACVKKHEAKFTPQCQAAFKLLRQDPNWKE